jgi:hypothetical protein
MAMGLLHTFPARISLGINAKSLGRGMLEHLHEIAAKKIEVIKASESIMFYDFL